MPVRAVRKPDPTSAEVQPRTLSVTTRVLLSVILSLHVLAVFMGPFTFATSVGPGMASPFAEPLRRVLRPYIDFAFLDHGYFFFAPNPGPSHLLRATLEFSDGRPPQQVTLPDRNQQWSRLLYHRHFMLAEQFHAETVPPQPPPAIATDPVQLADWRQARSLFELRKESFVDHLREAYGASRVTLTRIEHAMISPGEFTAVPRSIQSPDTYRELDDDPAASSPLPGVRP